MHRILHVGKNIGNFIYYNVPLMMIIALMLALVETPMMTWTQMNMFRMLKDETSNLLRPGNSQAATVKDSPQSALPTSPLTVWYRESVRSMVRLP